MFHYKVINMGNRRTSVCIDRMRIISTGKKCLDLWLTLRNIKKFDEKEHLYVFLGRNNKQNWIRNGIFKIQKKYEETKLYKGNTYVKCRLEKLKEEESVGRI